MTTIQLCWRKARPLVLAICMSVLMICLSAMPAAARAADPGSAPGVTPGGGVAARAAAPTPPIPPALPMPPMPITGAIRSAAQQHSAGLTQAPTPPRRRTAAGCAGRIALFGALGAGTGLAAAGALLASTGGSDDTSGILTRSGLLGAGAGAMVGALLCGA